MNLSTIVPPMVCPSCGTELAQRLLACPSCGKLVHSDALKSLAAEAESAAASGAVSRSLAAWRGVLEMLPPGTPQHAAVTERIATLGRAVDASPKRDESDAIGSGSPAPTPAATPRTSRSAIGALVAAVLAFMAKIKMGLGFILTKGKVLLLGLTKIGTLSSMLLSLGLYSEAWGWKFAAGLIASIYIHEMGHVAALRRYGFSASAPMFIPFLGAAVRLRQPVTDPRQDARVGLAGPVWGLGAAIAAFIAYQLTDEPMLGGIAGLGAWINLFNLLPFVPLDGGRGFRSLSRLERWVATFTVAIAYVLTHEGLLAVIGLLAGFQALRGPTEETSDRTGLALYCGLIGMLSALVLITHKSIGPM